MPKEIEITPEMVTFYCGRVPKWAYTDIIIRNKTAKRMAFKVRCTSASLFRVFPQKYFVQAGNSREVHLWYTAGRFIESTKHYFAIHAVFNDSAVEPAEAFADKNVKPDGVKRLPVTFDKAVPPPHCAACAAEELKAAEAPSVVTSVTAPAPSQTGPAPPAAAPTPPTPAK